MTDFSNVLDNVPHFKRYMTVDELHQRSADMVNEYPDKVELIDLGKSTNGETIPQQSDPNPPKNSGKPASKAVFPRLTSRASNK